MSTLTIATLRRRFARDDTAVSAVEFGIVLPLLILIYLGGVELSQAITVDRKLTVAGNSVGDLVAQGGSEMSKSELEEIFMAANAIMTPYSSTPLKIVVSSVKIDKNGDEVESSCGYHDTPRAEGSSITVPDGVRVEGSYLVITEVSYDFEMPIGPVKIPPFGYVVGDAITFNDTFYMRPRQVDSVTMSCPTM